MVFSKNIKNVGEHINKASSRHRLMTEFIKTKTKPKILEFGVERGSSTSALVWMAEKIDGKVFSVDINDCSDVVRSDNWQFLQCNDLDFQLVLKNFTDIENEGLDLIYIDSYHENYHVEKLLNIYFKYLKKGGAFFIADTESFPLRQKKDIWNSIVYDLTDEMVKNFYFNNHNNVSYTKYFGGNGLSKLEKRSNFLDLPAEKKKIWNYNLIIKLIYPYLRKIKNFIKKK